MKDDKYFWDYQLQPGMKLNNDYYKSQDAEPLVTIVTSFYNAQEFMWQTINCVFNQTFPYWEWIIVDDGSTQEEALDYLKQVEKMDNRIKVYHKENEGLARGRDYAIKHSKTKYILPLDADDLIEPTYIETLYWTMEINKEASWAFTNSVGFGKYIYLVDHKFDSEKMKTENQITATALIRKDKILNLSGYGVAKRYVNEDWHLWLRMLAEGDYPVQVTYYGFWYRRRMQSLLTEVNDTKKKENELRLRDLKIEADKITKRVEPVIYSEEKTEDLLQYNELNFDKTFPKENKETILYILPQIGCDAKLYKQIEEKNNKFNIIVITLEKTEYSEYVYRQKYEKFATVFNLTTFLPSKYYLGFIEYIIKTRNINEIYMAKNKYSQIIQGKFKITDNITYRNSKFVYILKILEYKLNHTIIVRAIRKAIRLLKS